MTTISQIVTDAYREANLIALGASPTAAEQDEALRILNRFVSSLFGNEFGEQLGNVALGRGNIQTPDNVPLYMEDISGYYVPINTRIQCNLTSPQTINLTPQPMDGSRFAVLDNSGNLATYNLSVFGNGRLIEGATELVLNTNNLSREWIYRDDLGQWMRLTDLTLSDNSPFPKEFDDMLIGGITLRLAPRSGFSVSAESQVAFQNSRRKFYDRYRQVMEQPSEQGIIRLPSNRLFRWAYSNTNQFDRGLPVW